MQSQPGSGHGVAVPAGAMADEGIHIQPIAQRIDWLLARAAQHSMTFSASEAVLARERHRALHPTALAAMKCMDGRLNLAYATGTPIGLIQPFRNLGGRFDLGWPHLGEVLSAWVLRQVRDGRCVLLLLNYHFSQGCRERGCAGFGFDTGAARAHLRAIRASQRAPEVEHREWVLCVGRGFDVLHMPNHALIVGPYSPRLDQSIDTAAGIIESNMRAGRMPDDGFLLLASVPFEEPGPDRARA
jgi:hypothetical protein